MKQYESRVRAVADELQPLELRRLLHYLCDMVLKRPPPAPPAIDGACQSDNRPTCKPSSRHWCLDVCTTSAVTDAAGQANDCDPATP